MIFGYTVAEAKKAVIAFVGFGIAIAAMFIAYDPGINEAIFSIVGAVFGVIGVFAAPQFSIEDLSKSLEALKGAGLALANYWFVMDPSWSAKISTTIAAAVGLYAIYLTNNEKRHNVVSTT